MEIKLFTNQNAKKYIGKIVENKTQLEPLFYMNVHRWLNETRDVKCYVLCDKDIIRNIILLSKLDFDPFKIHKTPFCLDYIYTFTEHRRNNLACRMLLYLKKKEQITAFCSNDESEKLFKKAEYNFNGFDQIMEKLPVFRYP